MSIPVVVDLGVTWIASMRPGQAAPDEHATIDHLVAWHLASMRPGQAAPDENGFRWLRSATAARFNEAGASSPG